MMITPEQHQALEVARGLVRSGVPVFLAYPDPSVPTGYKPSKAWHLSTPDPQVVDQWRPGLALCAVTGHGLDLIDVDPRSGGSTDGVPMPEVYLAAETPSGGAHYFVRSLGVPSLDGVFPGVDLKSGTADGSGRGFAFIAPTVRRSKVDGVERTYRWVGGCDFTIHPGDSSGQGLAARVYELRAGKVSSEQPRRVARSAAAREFDAVWNRLVTDLRRWASTGWGGEAHSGLLAATTFLARLAPDHAEHSLREAFRAADLEPDAADLAKLESALARVVPDVVVPDEQMSPSERFLSGGDSPLAGSSAPARVIPGAEGRRRFQPMTREQAAHIVPPEPLIGGVLLRGTKARISGPSGAGKTWVVLDMAAHVAVGRDWQGHMVKQGRVLYVAAEGAPSFDLRMCSWDALNGTRAEVHLIPDAPQVMDSTWSELIFEIVEAGGYDLVIFDTQGAVTVGSEENSNRDANVAQARLGDLITATGACVLLVHHTGWEDGDRPRGASAMYGGMDTELVLSRVSKEEVTLKNPKQRYIEEFVRPLKLRMVRSGAGLAIAPLEASTPESFFTSVKATEDDVRVTEVLGVISAYYAAGGTAKSTVRALTATLRTELNVTARNEIIREAILRHNKALGMPVQGDEMGATA